MAVEFRAMLAASLSWRLCPMNYLVYLFPISAVVSLVYSATRYEHPPRVISNALRLFVKIIVFMAAAMAILAALSWNL